MNSLPVISIVICTRNRCEDLKETLSSLRGLELITAAPAELIVVDNNSTDDTPQFLRHYRMEGITFRPITEINEGLSCARNRGLKEALGSVILFTDDDVRVPRNWLGGMCSAILDGHADAVAGGIIFPAHLLDAATACRNFVGCTRDIDPSNPERMVGANMAVAAHVFEKIPAFDEELGAGALGFAEETLFSKQMHVAGFRLISALNVAVEHHFQRDRLTRTAILRAAAKIGCSYAYIDYHWNHASIPRKRRVWRLAAELFVRRAFSPQILIDESYAPDWELDLLAQLRGVQFCRSLRNSARKYEQHGLIKRSYQGSLGPSERTEAGLESSIG